MIAADALLNDFIFRHTSDGILIINAQGTIEAANPAAASLLDLSENQLLGASAPALFAANPPLLNLLTSAPALDVSLANQRIATATVALLANARRVLLLHDVTEQRNLIAHREKFIRVTAHDLRNPIAALIGYASLIETSGQLDEEHLHYLSRLQDTTSKLHHAAAEIVELAWIEAEMPLGNDPLALNDAIASAVASLATLAHERGITVSLTLQEPLPLVLGDAAQMQSVLRKLLHNAIHYSAEGKTVTIRTWSEATDVFCSFTDEGIGIAENELEVVFDRLYRSRDPRVKALPGGGLGLTVARKIIRHYGGEITLVSQPDQGSTFTIHLPTLDPSS